MANINSLMSSTSATGNLYGTRNVLSGLASGMDTESMIENSVSGYKTKITQLQQQQTKYEWKQDAYRTITDAMYNLNDKYASYTSKTNLYSPAFFNNASVTTVSGANQANVSASGKTDSDIRILSAQMATAARYSVSASSLSYGGDQNVGADISGKLNVAALDGKELNVTLNGVTKGVKLDLSGLTDGDNFKEDFADYLQREINKQFGEDNISVNFDGGKLKFDALKSASTLKVAGKDADAAAALGLGEDGLTNYLNANKTIRSLLGESALASSYAEPPKTNIDGLTQQTNSNGTLQNLYKAANGSYYTKKDDNQYYLSDNAGNVLHNLTINGANIRVSENASLNTVMDAINASDAGVSVTYSQLTNQFVFNAKETGKANGIQFGNGDGSDLSEKLFSNLKDNTVPAGTYVDGTDATVIAKVNGQNVALNRASNTFDMDGMSVTLKNSFGSSTADANGVITVDSADAANALSFSSKTDADGIVNTIKTFVDDYNSVLKQLHDAYATQPAEKSSSTHAKYEPLTEDDKSDMSEKAIESYEKKAKQGILFGDSDLRAAYEKLVNAITPGGLDGSTLRDIGINTTFSGGLTQISLNEEKLRSALDSNPDRVRDAFTKSKDAGAATDGLMSGMKNTMEQYASTSIATPGVLVKKAGSAHSSPSLLNNDVQKQINRVQEQIEKWQTKMSSKIDYYTRQFTALEKLMNTMNSQSSALAGLMGG
jgi:flagellar hook-associated protein 2